MLHQQRKEINMDAVVNLISNVGFPIAVCMGLMWYIKDQSEKRREETERFTDALNRNTNVVETLAAWLHEVLK